MEYTTQELDDIIDGSPKGGVLFDGMNYCKFDIYERLYTYTKQQDWYPAYDFEGSTIHMVSDLKEIRELRKILKGLDALGFLIESYDSSSEHKRLCEKYRRYLQDE